MLTKDELHAELTARVIAQLEQGRAPWLQPWDGAGFSPTNAVTKHRYTGVNALWLSLIAEFRGYERGLWVTYKGAQDLGGYVRKGEKSSEILKPTITRQKFVDGVWVKIAHGELVPSSIRTRKNVFYSPIPVWNIAQLGGEIQIPAEFLVSRAPVDVPEGVKVILDSYENAPSVFHKEMADGEAPHYSKLTDAITLPLLEQFKDGYLYAETIAHEIIHSTGHESRLNRWKDEPFTFHGDTNYSKEELVAEIGAVTLLHQVGVEVTLDNHASYLAGWLRPLQDDPKFLVDAITKADKAVERVLGKVEVKEEVSA
jgi:antirestriction protein ArdC